MVAVWYGMNAAHISRMEIMAAKVEEYFASASI